MTIDSENILNSILSSLERIDYIKPTEIPNIDLYMDQVTTFMEEHLQSSKRYPDDKILTKTMINNYAKNHLLPAPDKKKYSKEHLLLLIYIYYYKSILSIGDIQSLLEPLTQRYFHKDGEMNMQSIYEEVFSLEKEQVEKMQKEYGHAMNGFLTPLYQKDAFKAGSTDVGDVSWLTPTAQIHVAAWPNGCPGHSWQNVSCDRTEIGHKAAVHAGKVIAATAIDLIEDTSLLDEARAEFEKRTKDGFVCPIPADAVPVIPD